MGQTMSYKRIDSLGWLDCSTISLEDVRWQIGSGIAISSGAGRDKKYRYRNGVITNIGDIEEHIWYQLVEQIAQRENEIWLVNALAVWEGEHNYACRSPAQIREEAWKLYSMRIFDEPEWVHYIPFNRRFRPDALAGAHTVTVINGCCNKPGEVTQEQIDRACGGTVACPHCGRWSEFSVVSGEEPPWEEF